MERDINLKKIAAYFSRISSEVKMLNCLGLYDINKISETICIPLLKEIYSLPNLKNLNATQDNFPAIDLACDQSKKSFQITSTSSSAKILNTLTKYKKYGLDKIYINVKVFILTEKQKSYTSKQLIQIAKETNFNIQDDIIDFSSLLVIIEREHDATLSGIILDILDSEFKKIDKFTIIRDKLDGLQERTLEKISNEIKTKKYIPNVYCEPVHVKNKARIFSNPLFFHRKIFRKLSKIDVSILNEYLKKLNVDEIQFNPQELVELVNSKGTYKEFLNSIESFEKYINLKASEFDKYNAYGDQEVENIGAPVDKEDMASLLKYAIWGELYPIINLLKSILDDIKLIKSKVFLITSFAGQGKTNFLCDFAEKFTIAFDIPTVFIPARELNKFSDNHITQFITNQRYFSTINDKFELCEFAESISESRGTPFLIIIDGINEIKNSESFKCELIDFINVSSQYIDIKLMVTCRSEFFDKNFDYLANSSLEKMTYRIKDLKREFTDLQLSNALRSYFKYFEIEGSLSNSAKSFLLDDFLLLRIFCESSEGTHIGKVTEIYKVELFETYIFNVVAKNYSVTEKKRLMPTIFKLIKSMLEANDFINISLSNLDAQQINIVEKLVHDDIILRRELPSESLLDLGAEQVNFTYDELRDFLIAFYFIDKCNNFSGETALVRECIDMINNTPSQEGVIKYFYLLTRIKKNVEAYTEIENITNFHSIYSSCIMSIREQFHTDNDLVIVNKILSSYKDREPLRVMAYKLFIQKDLTRILNISVLIDFINTVEDCDYKTFISIMLDDHYSNYHSRYCKADKYISDCIKAIEGGNKISENGLTFSIQVAVLSNGHLQYELINSIKNLPVTTIESACDYLNVAKCSFLMNLRNSIRESKNNAPILTL